MRGMEWGMLQVKDALPAVNGNNELHNHCTFSFRVTGRLHQMKRNESKIKSHETDSKILVWIEL